MLKKIISLLLVVAMTASVSIGATVAYFQDDASDVNVMTVGNVSIRQDEYQRVEENGVFTAELEDFQQGKLMMPYVSRTNTPENITIGDVTAVFNDQYANYVDKIVAVTNTGKSDAYVRTLIALPTGGVEKTDSASDNWLHWNTWGKNPETGVYDMDETWDSFYDNDVLKRAVEIVINGMEYRVWEFVHTAKLAAGATACPTLTGVFMDCRVNNDDIGYYMDLNSNNKFDADTEKRINIPVGEPLCVYVLSQAVQTAGFEDAFTALDTAFGDVDGNNAAAWFGGITVTDEIGITEAGTYDLEGDVYTIDSAYFHTQKVTGAPVTINGNGATVEGIATSVDAFQWEGGTIPAMSAIFSSADGSKVTVNDLKFTGTMSAIMLGHYQNATYNNYNTELNNVDVIGTEVVSFSSGVSPAVAVYGTAVLNNCNVYGTTLSELDTDPMWPVYDVVAVNYTDLTVNNSKIGSLFMWNQAGVTVAAGSEVDKVVILGNMNATKYGLTVKAGATVDVIDLSAITNKAKVNITIEDGANVGKFVANGTDYATLADWKNA